MYSARGSYTGNCAAAFTQRRIRASLLNRAICALSYYTAAKPPIYED